MGSSACCKVCMKKIEREVQDRLLGLQDVEYGAFQAKLLPTVAPETIIGVRTPALRVLAKELRSREDIGVFLEAVPHRYFDENQLHAFLLSLGKDYDATLAGVDAFLPYVDNWATCDQMSPKVFGKHRAELLTAIDRWMASEHVYTVRFGVGMLMQHYLDEAFRPEYPERVAALQSDEYYVNMMIAWYFATALAKQYDATVPYIERHRLEPWTHNKAIQKAVESYRVPEETKQYLRTLKVKTPR